MLTEFQLMNFEGKEEVEHCHLVNSAVIMVEDSSHKVMLKLFGKRLKRQDICIISKYLSQDVY